jgi:hypothetical protein
MTQDYDKPAPEYFSKRQDYDKPAPVFFRKQGNQWTPVDDPDPIWEPDPTAGTCKHKCHHRNGIVWLSNGEDDYYEESFKSREELEEFINRLRACADECWPH